MNQFAFAVNQKKKLPPAFGTSAAIATAGNPVSNWRNQKRTASERYAHLLETGDGADVYFLVGKPGEVQELIAAHKTILYASSEVFEAQFGFPEKIGSLEGTKEKPIEVRDVRPDAFRAMLKFIYTDDFSGVTKQNVMEVYNAGKKYMLDTLVNSCRQSLLNKQNLGVDNVLSVLKHAQQHGDKDIIDHCWSFVDSNATAILGSNEFLFLSQHDLYELFSRDSLYVDELFLFQSLHRWAITRCGAAKQEPTPQNLRTVVGEVIYKIRIIPCISQQKFTDEIVPTSLLNKDDIIALYVHFNGIKPEAKRQYPNRFNGQQRHHSYNYYPQDYYDYDFDHVVEEEEYTDY